MPRIVDKFCNYVIEYSFYLLFFIVPLVFTSSTSELFEFNKMWVTFGITILIVCFWSIRMIVKKKFFIQKTPLDIPILLFLASQFLSTLFSWDRHVSLWGYYSRFNGGFLSTLSYIALYYAFVTQLTKNTKKEHEGLPFFVRILLFLGGIFSIIIGTYLSAAVPNHQAEGNALLFYTFVLAAFFFFIFSTSGSFLKRTILISLISGFVVASWGVPSHFGFDPTCLLFRGNFDVSCWNEAFQPKIRIFSTLGQPNWLAAYLSVLIPLSIAFTFLKKSLHTTYYLLLTALFYAALIFTDARSGFLGLWTGLLVFFSGLIYLFKNELNQKLVQFISLALVFIIATFLFGSPIVSIRKLTYPVLKLNWTKNEAKIQTIKEQEKPAGPALETGGTESGAIRLNVWRGAIDAFKDNFLFGTGVETFAFTYYKYKPQPHNLTSEWDYLYNKAHNEYLNYLATTGILGLGSYLFMIGYFLFYSIRRFWSRRKAPPRNDVILANERSERVQNHSQERILVLALLAGYISILVSNFFGFSVVIINIYLFLIPAIVFGIMMNTLPQQKNAEPLPKSFTIAQGIGIIFLLLIAYFLISTLIRFWYADAAFALGSNLDKTGNYDRAYIRLKEAVSLRPSEPVFKDELSINEAILAIKFAKEKETKTATDLARESIELSNKLNADFQNNVVFLKTRVRVFSQLAQVNEQFLQVALDALLKAKELAPTDAKIAYNLGVVSGELGNKDQAIAELIRTTKLKPNYLDAYYALGLYYHQLALDQNGKVVNQEYFDKGVAQMRYIISHFSNSDSAKNALKTWSIQD